MPSSTFAVARLVDWPDRNAFHAESCTYKKENGLWVHNAQCTMHNATISIKRGARC